jgi:DNA modification methylase
MNFLNNDIGSAKDNLKSPIHNWYKFTAGFSHCFVDEVIKTENLLGQANSKIFDPFAGCGTTLVSSQKAGVAAVGNEGQEFMFDVIKGKLNWDLTENEIENYLTSIKNDIAEKQAVFDICNVHPLLKTLYTEDALSKLYTIKNSIQYIELEKYKLFFKLALSQTLHKVCIHPIAVPYISRSKTLSHTDKALEFFIDISRQMFKDTEAHRTKTQSSKIYLHDSRSINKNIQEKECNVCITSPPYLNNLDYGEVSKVHSHFFEHTTSWKDITNTVRKNLVTGATTHYSDSDFLIEDFKKSDFYLHNPKYIDTLIEKSAQIKKASKEKGGKKSFHILSLLYFQDMYYVLNEIKRVITDSGKAYLILGDSAPYGIFVPTTEILGEIAKGIGFNSSEIHKIRTRGTKWKTLRFRHSLELDENVLLLK